MKQIFATIISLLLVAYGKSQSTDTSRYKVTYSFTHTRDTTNPLEIYKETMILYVGREASLYKSAIHESAEGAVKKLVDEQLAMSPQQRQMNEVSAGALAIGSTAMLYKKGQNLTIIEDFSGKTFLIKDSIPYILWELKDSSRMIGQFRCQLATGSFRGRKYEAWFTSQIPLSSGPWKLGGLPGMILEANDADRQVAFRFIDIENMSNITRLIAIPEGGIGTTLKELEAAKNAVGNISTVSVQASSGNTSVKISVGSEPSRAELKRIKSINNPIEKQ